MTSTLDVQREQVAAGSALIEAHGLTKHYDGFTLNNVTFSVQAGQVVGFVGQNGAGKSTTIKALLGIIELDAGEARILDAPSAKLAHDAQAAAVKEQIGVVFDTVSLPGQLKVGEVGEIMARAYRSWDAQVFEGHLETFGLDAGKTAKALSRGMGMKLGLACALSHHPRVLILDEATAGLDPLARDEVLDMLREFVAAEDERGNPQNAILMSSHITSDLDKIADQIICIDRGEMVFALAKDEITDMMGIARCRAAEVEDVVQSGALVGAQPRMLRHDYGIDLLVPDRFAFAQVYPDIPCDRMTIDDYMAFMLKGSTGLEGANQPDRPQSAISKGDDR